MILYSFFLKRTKLYKLQAIPILDLILAFSQDVKILINPPEIDLTMSLRIFFLSIFRLIICDVNIISMLGSFMVTKWLQECRPSICIALFRRVTAAFPLFSQNEKLETETPVYIAWLITCRFLNPIGLGLDYLNNSL